MRMDEADVFAKEMFGPTAYCVDYSSLNKMAIFTPSPIRLVCWGKTWDEIVAKCVANKLLGR